MIHIIQYLDRPSRLALALVNKYFYDIVQRNSGKDPFSPDVMCDAKYDVRPMLLLRNWMPQEYQLQCRGDRLQYKKGRAAERARQEGSWHCFLTPNGVSWGAPIASQHVCRKCVDGYGKNQLLVS